MGLWRARITILWSWISVTPLARKSSRIGCKRSSKGLSASMSCSTRDRTYCGTVCPASFAFLWSALNSGRGRVILCKDKVIIINSVPPDEWSAKTILAGLLAEPVALSRPQNSQNCIGVWRRRLQRCQFVVSWCLKAWPRSLSW